MKTPFTGSHRLITNFALVISITSSLTVYHCVSFNITFVNCFSCAPTLHLSVCVCVILCYVLCCAVYALFMTSSLLRVVAVYSASACKSSCRQYCCSLPSSVLHSRCTLAPTWSFCIVSTPGLDLDLLKPSAVESCTSPTSRRE